MTQPIGRVQGRYAVEVGGKPVAPSVTGVLGLLNKDGLAWGAAKETALFAIHHRDEWEHLDAESAYHRLRKHHAGVWSDKAKRGTLVHSLNAEWVAGNEVECPPDCVPYVDALERFWTDLSPTWIEVERSVVYNVPGLEFGGSFDAVVDIAGRRTLLDLKTGKRYPIETTAQLAAYRYAQGMAVYSPLGGLESIEPMPEVDATAVLYLHEDGTYELLEVPGDRASFDAFLALRRVWNWTQAMESWVKKHPERKAVPA